VNAADVLSEVFFAREAGSGAALAVWEGAEERFLCAAVQFVDFTLVAQESAAVGEALQLLTALDIALVRSVVLVHVFTCGNVSESFGSRTDRNSPPFALAIECNICTLLVLANHLAVWVSWRLLGTLVGMVPSWRKA
jgi:hypothetical protein